MVVATYIFNHLSAWRTLHFILFMMKRRVQTFAKIRQHSIIQNSFCLRMLPIETNTISKFYDEIECYKVWCHRTIPLQIVLSLEQFIM